MMAYGICKICGCTDDHACIKEHGPCWWVDEDHTLCSGCVAALEEKESLGLSERDCETYEY
ncbi:MAG: hypothetical protein K0Q87_186 [Neobacillus sp.]|jgi:hypothetical protein|nr:hypothetical protein [Neobacillus sp.]